MKQFKSRGLFWLFLMVAIMESPGAFSQNYSISTNAAQLMMLGTVNVRGSIPVSRHWNADAALAYNPFTFGKDNNRKYFRRLEFFAGGRYWPWFVNSGWYMSAYALWAKYAWGGIFTRKSYEGYAYGAKLGGGYALVRDKGINLEFGWGAFMGINDRSEYSCTKCGSSLGRKKKFIIAPSDLQLGVTILF